MPPFLIPLIIVAVFGVIVLLVILLKKKVSFFKDPEAPKSDKEIAKEELDRLLEPVEELTPKQEEEEQPAEEASSPEGQNEEAKDE